MVEPVVEIRVVAPVLDQTAGMRDGGAIALEKVTDLGEAHPTADMGEIHRDLPRKRGSRRAPRPAAQILDSNLEHGGAGISRKPEGVEMRSQRRKTSARALSVPTQSSPLRLARMLWRASKRRRQWK